MYQLNLHMGDTFPKLFYIQEHATTTQTLYNVTSA